MSIDPAALRAFPEFAQLDDAAIEQLRAHLRPIVLAPGSILFHQGDHDPSLYLLVEGTVEVRVRPPGGDDQVAVATLQARTLLGELGLLLGVPRTATILTRTRTVCWQISRDSFYAAVERGEAWTTRLALAIATVLARRFVLARDEVNRHVDQLPPHPAEPAGKVRELAQLRRRLLSEWSF
jgi:CRP-like cAMP-binding protein